MTVDVDERLVARLLRSQFPEFARLPIRRVSAGTVNAVFRAGDRVAIRLPLSENIQDWDVDCALAALAGKLPLEIPEVFGTGEPDDGYPLKWSVHSWVAGEAWQLDRVEDPATAAVELADFLGELHRIDPASLPCPPLLTGHVVPLIDKDRGVRVRAARSSEDEGERMLRIWEAALSAGEWDGVLPLIHWDLRPENVVIRDGRLAGVIDWGALTTGDPARDLVAAWTLFAGESRDVFRAAATYDEDTWTRARGWALMWGESRAEVLMDLHA